jgi:hypothetical protein
MVTIFTGILTLSSSPKVIIKLYKIVTKYLMFIKKTNLILEKHF